MEEKKETVLAKKASDLIAELQQMIDKHGDLDIVVIDDRYKFFSEPVVGYSEDMFGYYKGREGFRIY